MKALLKGALLGSAVALAAVPVAASAAPTIVTNGDFGTGDFTGWSQFGNTGFTGVSGGAAYFGPVGSVGGIAQTIATIAGKKYAFSYDLQNDGGTPNSFSATVGGNTLGSFSNAGAFGFTTFTGTFVATGTNDTLSFGFQQNPAYYRLDNISISAVPEPATWGLMILGFGAVGGVMRRKSAVRTTVRYA